MNIRLLCLILFLIFSISSQAQITPIPQNAYTVQSYSSDNTSHPVADAFDGDSTTWWAIWNSAGFSLPAVVELDLGSNIDVAGFSYHPNPAQSAPKALSFEIYLSNDGSNWGTPEAERDFIWANSSDVSLQTVEFGAVSGRYVKVVFPTSQKSDNNIHTSEMVIFESTTPATGQANQIITFPTIDQKIATDPDFALDATSSSGLTVSYEIVSGPATVSGNILSLDGTGGTVVVKAIQAGDANYYPSEAITSFEVIDLLTFFPNVKTRLSETFPLQMDSLSPYPIYVNADIDPLVEITSVEVVIDGVTYQAHGKNGLYTYLWTPTAFGIYDIDINAYASNGNVTSINRNINVLNVVNGFNVRTMEDVVIWFGRENSRWFYGEYSLPQQVGIFDQITAYLTIECPENNCDDWDRLAYIDVKAPDGNWVQIIRYITPYNVACNHQIDLTDYLSLLQGDIEMRMFIDTWGTGGWQVTLDLDHRQGSPQYRYSLVDEIWDKAYDLGNPTNLQPVDTINYSFAPNVQKSTLRLSTTGHGWGDNNSQNAAEFYNATHFIDIDNQQTFTQNLWNVCNPNPDGCSPQAGTWQFSRAGWCPGMISPPNVYDLSANIPNEEIQITYRFDPTYQDFCHPGNPNCISGTTCPNCNDGYKAVNHVDGQIINYSNMPMTYGEPTAIDEIIDNTQLFDIQILPNPSQGLFQIQTSEIKGQIKLRIYTIDGRQVKAFYFNSFQELNQYAFDLTDQGAGTYFISVENEFGAGVEKVVIQ